MTAKHETDPAGDACLTNSSYTATDVSVLSFPDGDKTPSDPEKKTAPSPSSSRETVPAESISPFPLSPTPAGNDNDSDARPNYGATDVNEKDAEGLERQPSAATTINFPEGGLKGWLVVFGSFCAMMSLYGLINSAAVFESYFRTHQLTEYNPSEIGWIFSLYLFLVFFVGIQVGPIFDQFGPRLLVAVGSTLVVLSLLLLSWCEGAYFISIPQKRH